MTSSTHAWGGWYNNIDPENSWLYIAKVDIRKQFESWCDSNTNQYVFQEEKTGTETFRVFESQN